MRNGLGKNLVLFPAAHLTDAIILQTCNHDFFKVLCILFFLILIISTDLMIFSYYGKSFDLFVDAIILCVGAGVSNLMSIFYGFSQYFLRQKMEKTRPMKGEMDGDVFISRQSRHFFFINGMIKVLFPICTLTWRVNNYVSCHGKGIKRRNENTTSINIDDFGTVEVIFIAFHFELLLILKQTPSWRRELNDRWKPHFIWRIKN